MGKKKRTSQIFGPVIDRYPLADAEADGAVVRIFYEGNTVKGAVRDGRDLDEVFERCSPSRASRSARRSSAGTPPGATSSKPKS